MQSEIPTYTDFSRNGIINSRMRIINKLLLYDVLTRKELCEELNVSMATVTNHAQNLIANEVLLSETIPGINSNRPIQKLSLNADMGLCAAISISPESINAELIKLDTGLLETLQVPVKSKTQMGVSIALEEAAIKIDSLAKAHGDEVVSGVIGFKGVANPPAKTIFSIEGIPKWEPCSPLTFLKYFDKNPVYDISTWIMAKCKGFAKQQQCDRHIGIVEFSNQQFHISVIYNEQFKLGHLGTSSPYLHCTIKDGFPCYCGRENCFNSYISNGGFDPEVLNEGLNKMFKEIKMSIVGLEFSEHPQTVKALCDNGLSIKPVVVENGDELFRNGLRIIAAEKAWNRILTNIFANK